MTRSSVIKKQITISSPKFVTNRIDFGLAKTGFGLPLNQIKQPHALGNQIPGTFVTVGAEGAVIGAKLEVTNLMRVFEHIKPAGAVQVCQGDTPIFDQIIAFFETRAAFL